MHIKYDVPVKTMLARDKQGFLNFSDIDPPQDF